MDKKKWIDHAISAIHLLEQQMGEAVRAAEINANQNTKSMQNHSKVDSAKECSAFFGCPNLERVVITNKGTVIGDEAFALCSKLKEVIMPNDPLMISAHNVFAKTPFEQQLKNSSAPAANDENKNL